MNLVPVTRTVEVTVDDIAKGQRHHCQACPVAIAVKRVFPEVTHVTIYEQEAIAYNPEPNRLNRVSNRTSSHLPVEVTEFIQTFDNKKEVQPFSFSLTLSVNEAKLPLPPPTGQAEPSPV